MLFESYEVAHERMDDFRRQAEKYRRGAEVTRRRREEERPQHAKRVKTLIHELVDRLSWRPREVARG